MQECTKYFLEFVTSEALDQSKAANRRTISAEDILTALDKLGFDNYFITTNWYYGRMKEAKDALQ